MRQMNGNKWNKIQWIYKPKTIWRFYAFAKIHQVHELVQIVLKFGIPYLRYVTVCV